MKTINDWKPEVKSLFDRLLSAGFTLLSVDNGEEETVNNFADSYSPVFVEEAIACDEFRLYAKQPNGKTVCLFCVLGNSPGELPADYTDTPELVAVCTAHSEEWDGKTQPTCPDPYAKR